MKQKIIGFWDWFCKNEQRFLNGSNENLLEIQDKLEFASNSEEYGIALEFSEPTEQIKRLEISADGVRELFDIVKQIVEMAPSLNNWEFVAFRQPIPTPFCLRFENMEFDTSKMFFLPYKDANDELNLVIFGDNFKGYNENELFHYGLTTIDNLIGEYNCVTKVSGYDFVDKIEIGDNEVYPLEELPKFLEYLDD